jgi:hypothetical protein
VKLKVKNYFVVLEKSNKEKTEYKLNDKNIYDYCKKNIQNICKIQYNYYNLKSITCEIIKTR